MQKDQEHLLGVEPMSAWNTFASWKNLSEGPLGPVDPVAPTGPVGPVLPAGRKQIVSRVFTTWVRCDLSEGPLGPIVPVAPVAPVAPDGPVLPAGRKLRVSEHFLIVN